MRSEHDLDLVARDRALPGLAALLDADLATPLLAPFVDGMHGPVEITYLRYKPGQSCLAAIVAHGANGPERVAVKAWRVGDPAMANHQVVLDAERGLTLTRFPHDRRVRGAAWLLAPERTTDAMQRLGLEHRHAPRFEVLAWKPERRVVLRLDGDQGPHAVIKAHAPADANRALAAARALGVPAPVRTAAPIGFHEQRGVIVTPWLSGDPVTTRHSDRTRFMEAGEALATLHAAALPQLAPRDAEASRLRRRRLSDDLTIMLPSVARLVTSISHSLASEPTGRAPLVPTHGDFYAKQLIATAHGLAIIDFDEAALGDPTDDLATFLAHVERDVLRGDISAARGAEVSEAFLRGYGRDRDRTLERGIAAALLDLAPHPFRHRAPDWPALSAGLLERAHQLLHPAPRRTHAPGLGDDRALAFAAPLLDLTVARDALRRCHPELPALAVIGAEVRRVRAGRRALLGWRVVPHPGAPAEGWLGKVRVKGTDHRIAELHRALWDAGLHAESPHGVSVPEPLGVLDPWRLVLQREVGGETLTAAIRGGASAGQVGRRVGAALRTFHDCGVRPGRTWHVEDELRTLRERFDTLATTEPGLVAALSHAWPRLVSLAAPLRSRGPTGCIHRDFYHDQVLLAADRTWIIDLDLCALGDPALDVGNVIAHLLDLGWRGQIPERVVDEVIRGIRTAWIRPGDTSSADAIDRWTVLALARLVEIATRHADRRPFVGALLSRVVALLPGRARVHATPPSLLEVAP